MFINPGVAPEKRTACYLTIPLFYLKADAVVCCFAQSLKRISSFLLLIYFFGLILSSALPEQLQIAGSNLAKCKEHSLRRCKLLAHTDTLTHTCILEEGVK